MLAKLGGLSRGVSKVLEGSSMDNKYREIKNFDKLKSGSYTEYKTEDKFEYIQGDIQNYKQRERSLEEKIEMEEKRYANLFHTAPIGIVETSSDGSPLSINQTMAEMLGSSDIEEVMENYADLEKTLYKKPKRRRDFIKTLRKNGEVKNFVFEANTIDGSTVWLSLNAKVNSWHEDDEFTIEIYVFDVTKRKEAQIELNRKQNAEKAVNHQLSAYNEEIVAINEDLDESLKEINELNSRFVDLVDIFSSTNHLKKYNEAEFLSDLLQTAVNVVPEAEHGIVYIYRDGKVEFIDSVTYDLDELRKIDIPAESFYNRKSSIEVIDIAEITRRNLKYMKKEDFEKLKQSSYIMKEIMYMDLEISGKKKAGLSLDIDAESDKNFSDNSRKIFMAFYNLASSFYRLKEYNNLQDSFTKELITSIVKLLEMYDLYTRGHSENVADLAADIAEEMELSKSEVDAAYWSGLVHDLGKLLVPLDIINKSGRLTDEEYELVKKHPVLGSRALESSESLKYIAKYVKHHHERWDGRGYPDGLARNEIPLISQILQIADSWDAMCSKRSYRDALSRKEALKEIKANKGSQFSPEIADLFLNMHKDKSLSLC